jgi:hypothetical protein
MDALIKTLAKSGLLREDLDYHLIRASMVIIFLFFWVSEVVRPRGVGVDSLYQQRASHLLDVSRVRHPGSQLVPGRLATSGPIPSHLHGVADERIAHHHHLAGLQFDIVDLKGRADDGGPDLILQKDDLAVRGRAYSHVQPRCHAHGHAGGPKSVTLRPYGAGTGLEARDRATISLADRNPSAA